MNNIDNKLYRNIERLCPFIFRRNEYGEFPVNKTIFPDSCKVNNNNNYILALFILFAIVYSCITPKTVFAKTDSTLKTDYYLGVIGGVSYIQNNTTLQILEGANDCGTFGNGTSLGWFAGIIYDHVFMDGFLEASGRVLYANRPASLQSIPDQTFEVFNPATGNYQPLIREHSFTATLQYVAFDIGARIRPVKEIPMYARASFQLALPVVSTNYQQKEEILSPENILFPNGQKTRIVGEGELQQAQPFLGLGIAIGAELPFQPDITLNPEIGWLQGINSLLSTQDWQVSMLNVGLGIRWRFGEKPPAPAVIPPPEIPVIPTPVTPIAEFSTVQTLPLEVEETVVTQTFPLLPYIFFNEANADILPQYKSNVTPSDFSEAVLQKETLPIYYAVLDILGKRMLQQPKAVLTLTGTTDGKEGNSASERISLAENRAKNVSKYLQQRWNIAPERMNIVARGLPEIPTSSEYTEGFAENRRVEISASEPEILAPVLHEQFIEYAPVRQSQEFTLTLSPGIQADRWEILLTDGNNLIATQQGRDLATRPVITLSPSVLTELARKGGDKERLTATVQLTTPEGKVLSAVTPVPIRRKQTPYEVSRLSLIVFDFDKDVISTQNEAMIRRFAATAFRTGSWAEITGSTDRLGEQQYNTDLSQRRANAVRNIILGFQPQAKILSTRGVGASVLPYDNNFPEGRYYCRTVSILVKTPR